MCQLAPSTSFTKTVPRYVPTSLASAGEMSASAFHKSINPSTVVSPLTSYLRVSPAASNHPTNRS